MMLPNPNLTIRRLTNEDVADFSAAAKLLDDMSQLHAEKVPEVFDGSQPPKDTNYVAELVAETKNQIYVAKEDGQVIGVLRASIHTAEDAPGWRVRRYGSIEAMFINPKSRRRGVGIAMMQTALDYFKQAELEMAELNVWDFNREAQALYRKLGFSIKNINLWRRL